ncbi:MAG: hypothetical protein K2K29_04545, partial [Muribaculaceae bacterium]|nr:hypothetical protein [Muribaculaceae bacterium]
IYTVDGVTKHKMDDTKELAYTFRPFGDATRGKLTTFNVGPAANNVAGESSNSIFVRDDIGSPYELPMKEEFNTANFSYFPYTFFTSQAYSGSTWENQGNLFNQGFTDIVPIEGVLVGSNEGRPTLAKTNLPKFTTEGIKKVVFVLRYLDYAHAPKFIQIYGRSSKDNEESYVGEITLKNPAKADWAESEVILPETLTDCPWVQLRVATNFAGNLDEYLIIDSYTIMPDADFDLKVSDLDGRTEATLGDDVSYNVVVANSGRERMSGKLLVELTTPDGKVLDSQSTDIRNLNSSQTADFTANFHIESSYSAYKTLRVVATVDSEGDENINNNMKVLDLSLMSSSLPIVNDLKANVNEAGNVDLSWSPAETEYGNFENFESYKPFADTESFDYWGNYNGDDLWPSFFQNQTTGTMVRWENDNKKLGWQVYDWYEMYNTDAEGTAYTTPAYIERLKPHSGRQALLARCGGYEEGSDPVATSKWLVSPLVKPGTMLSFYYTTFESSTTEYIEIWTCEKENGKFDPFDKNINLGRAGDFKKKTSKSKSGSEIWELVTYTLGRKDCQFALRYISYDGYAAAIDDLSFTPAQKLTRKAESYNVYRT